MNVDSLQFLSSYYGDPEEQITNTTWTSNCYIHNDRQWLDLHTFYLFYDLSFFCHCASHTYMFFPFSWSFFICCCVFSLALTDINWIAWGVSTLVTHQVSEVQNDEGAVWHARFLEVRVWPAAQVLVVQLLHPALVWAFRHLIINTGTQRPQLDGLSVSQLDFRWTSVLYALTYTTRY